MRRALLLILFFFTGATALGYQLVWTRMLANVLGHEMRAVLGVVTAFMGGMALGAWWLGNIIRRSAYPGRWYAGLEVFIGICAIVVPANVPWLLSPAVIAMGASFPAMVRFMRERGIAGFYAANVFGGVAGVIITAWVLLPQFGLRTSSLVLGALNILMGLTAWWVAGTGVEACRGTIHVERRSLTTIFVTGFLAIGFEVLGVRVLSQVMENTAYSFAAALAVYLLGTSLGATLYHRRGNERWFNNLMGSTTLICLGSTLVISQAQSIYNWLRSVFGDSVAGVATAEMILAACVFLGPTVCMGAIFSLLAQRWPYALPKMLAVNTLGSALAPLAIGVLLLPAIGSKWALVLVSLTYLAMMERWAWLAPALAALIVVFLPQFRFVDTPQGGAIVAYREGVVASVAVVRNAAGDRTLKVNNRFQMGGTSAAATEYRQAHFPLRLHPKPQRALFLGTGTGITFGATTQYPELQADGVELLPEVVEMMQHFKPQNFLDEYGNRLYMHIADARTFVKRPGFSYDVIVADLFHPSRDGAATLYTKEHFTAIRSRLNKGGIFCQWLPLHQMDETMLRSVVRTFIDVFPNTRAYLLHWSIDVPVAGLIGADQWPGHADQLSEDPGLSGGFIAGPEALQSFSARAPLNTDDHQHITYAAARFAYLTKAPFHEGLLTMLAIEGPPTDFLKARNVYFQGLIHEADGMPRAAIEFYLETTAISDRFTMGYARCISLAAAWVKDRPEDAQVLLRRLVAAKPEEKLARDLLQRLFPAPQN